MRTSYRERDYAYGATMLTLRTAIGLTQKGQAKHLGVSRRAVGDWEAGSTYPKAESFLQRALAIREKQLGKTHPDTATSLNNLASVYEGQGRHMEAERLYIRVLTIREHLLG